jgi:RNA polymerase sigma-70 factor (ECF subfamily)
MRAWLLALLHRVCESIVQSERRFRRFAPVSLERSVPPPPIDDDDEEFWEWYQPDDMTRFEDVASEPIELTPSCARSCRARGSPGCCATCTA